VVFFDSYKTFPHLLKHYFHHCLLQMIKLICSMYTNPLIVYQFFTARFSRIISIMILLSPRILTFPCSSQVLLPSYQSGIRHFPLIVSGTINFPRKKELHLFKTEKICFFLATLAYHSILINLLEPRGVKLLPEDISTRASPSAVSNLTLPPPDSY